MKRMLALFVGLAVSLSQAAELELEDKIREPVFAAAQAALKAANEAQGAVLAPENYRTGAENYVRAEETFEAGGKLERIEELLSRAETAFTAAAEISPTVREALSLAFAARSDAVQASSATNAPELWQAAEESFYEAASRVEAGRERGVERYRKKAEEQFREAELAAIEASLFSQIEQQIERARRANADDDAPVSYNQAVELLAEARSELARDRYDTDKPRDLATQALHHANHAYYVATLWEAVDDDETTFENVLLAWEAELRGIASLLDEAVYFDDGPAAASDRVRRALTDLQLAKGQLTNQLAEQRRHNDLLQQEIDQLQAELGGQSRARNRLQAELERQQRLKSRVQTVEGLFAKEEATVVRIEDRLVLRLIGLNFASGKADLDANHTTVLNKLVRALGEFPETPIVVEGHTDAYGADVTNLDLSNRRAQAVADYLLQNSPVSPALLTSVGYGETNPIANNETAEGRRKNRRIDVVLYPQW